MFNWTKLKRCNGKIKGKVTKRKVKKYLAQFHTEKGKPNLNVRFDNGKN